MSKTIRSADKSGNRKSIPLERTVTTTILKYLNSLPRCYAIKTHGNAYSSGQPDILGCLDGQAFALEVKRPKPMQDAPVESRKALWRALGATPLQVAMLEKWERSGAIVGVVRSVEDVERVLGLEKVQMHN